LQGKQLGYKERFNALQMTILSILIPTTPDRKEMFMSLGDELYRQKLYMIMFHPSLGEIEILVDDSKRFLDGGLSIGKKRESLAQRATGKYLCFLDSDESISPNYLETLVRLCNQDRDVCTFRAIAKLDNYWAIINMSLTNASNDQSTPDYTVLRLPFHVCPVRTEFAKRIEFEDINYGEDFKWMSQVLSFCKSEAHSQACILQYNHSSITSEADKITRYEVANKPF
jgi:hypothetical protein